MTTFTINGNGNQMVFDSTKVIVSDQVVVSCYICKKPIYRMDALYEFKDIPPELQSYIAYAILNCSRMNLGGLIKHPGCYHKKTSEKEVLKKETWFSKLIKKVKPCTS